jgi:hypothetical protein
LHRKNLPPIDPATRLYSIANEDGEANESEISALPQDLLYLDLTVICFYVMLYIIMPLYNLLFIETPKTKCWNIYQQRGKYHPSK